MKTDKKIYLDKKGYENYLKEISDLRELLNTNARIKSSAYTSAVGDGWHDNFEFEEAKRKELSIQKQLRDKVAGLSKIEIVEKMDNIDMIDIDDYIKIKMIYGIDDEEEIIVKLVATTPKDFSEISLNSPLGEALYQKKVGETTSYKVSENEITVEILFKSKANDFDNLIRKK